MSIGSFGDMLEGSQFNINDAFESSVNEQVEDISSGSNNDDNEAKSSSNNDSGESLDINSFFEDNPSDSGKDVDDNDDGDTPGQTNNSDNKSSSDSAPFVNIFARDLADQGLISSFDEEEFKKSVEEDGQAEALRKLFKNEFSDSIDRIKKDYDEGYQEFLDLVESGVSKENAGDLIKSKELFDSITEDQITNEDNEQLRRDILTENYRITTKFSDAKIKKLVDRAFELGEDVDEAKDALGGIKSHIKDSIDAQKEAAEQLRRQQEVQQKNSLEALKTSISSMDEIIPGQRINKQTKDKIYDLITKPVQDKNGNTTNALWAKRSEDPTFFDQRLGYLLETGFFEKGKSWDKVKNVKTTKEASQLEEFLSNNTSHKSGRMTIGNKDTSDMIKSTASILGRR